MLSREKKLINKYGRFFWIFLLLSLYLIYQSSFGNYFFGDDFFNLTLAKADNLKEVVNFFSLLKAPEEFPFYRPLTTQFYYWLIYKKYGLDPFVFHLVGFFFFLVSVSLVYKIIFKITKDKVKAYLTTFFYAFSSSHFYRLYYLSQFQELGLAVFYLLSLLFYLKHRETKQLKHFLYMILFFVLSVASKETAITLPLTMLLTDYCFYKKKQKVFKWLKERLKVISPILLITFAYLLIRIFYFGYSRGPEYNFIFKPTTVINNLFWYFLWSVGLPEHFVNTSVFEANYIFNPSFLTKVGSYGALSSLFFTIFAFFCLLGIKIFLEINYQKNLFKAYFKKKDIKSSIEKKKHNIFLIGLFIFGWFIITLSLVIFFPFHKFSYSLTLPLVAVSFLLALVVLEIIKFSKSFFFLALLIYMVANLNSINYAYETHWSVHRAKTACKVFKYFEENYPNLPQNSTVYFIDNDICSLKPKKTELSKELDNNLVGDKGLEFYYKKELNVFYQSEIYLEMWGLRGIIVVPLNNII